MSNTIGIAMKDEKSKTEMMAKLKTMPGETDAERLEYCLNAGMQSAKLSGKSYESMVDKVRTSQSRTLDLLVSTLTAADVEHETALAEKDHEIVALEDELRILWQEKKKDGMLLDQAQTTVDALNAKIAAMEKELNLKDELITSLQAAQKKQESQSAYEADVRARLKEIEARLQKMSGEQLSLL